MAVASNMLPLGTRAPSFTLPDVTSGAMRTLDELAGDRPLLLVFLCRHCPYVKHVQSELARLGHDARARGLAMVGISSNDASRYPDDAPASLAAMAKEQAFEFPILHDESQDVARAYDAACTPDFYLFDRARRLVYRGQLDDSRPGNGKPVTGRDVREAIDAVLEGRAPSSSQRPSMGCSIKWKA